MAKILITAFEPFGLEGKHVRGANASEQVLDKMRDNLPDDYILAVLPVSDRSEDKLKEILEREKPDGVISMGEDLGQFPSRIKIEPYALDMQRSALPVLFPNRRSKLMSEFALLAGAHPNHSTIGAYSCNRVYLTALKWAQENGNKPVVFTHIPILGNRDSHARQIQNLAGKMEDRIATRATAMPQTQRMPPRSLNR